MSEFNNRIELSETELDTIAGGAITLGDVKGYDQFAGNDFSQKNLTVGQKTVAGPEGSMTGSAVDLSVLDTFAGQTIKVG